MRSLIFDDIVTIKLAKKGQAGSNPLSEITINRNFYLSRLNDLQTTHEFFLADNCPAALLTLRFN
jgi:hypothetical protein